MGAIIRKVWEDGGRFDGWNEHFSFDRWMRCAEDALAQEPVDVAWYTTRERGVDEVLPWDHLDSGLDKDWLWEDWQDALSEVEVEDCRWTPCFDCGVCPQMGTEIQIGPTGRTMLPLTVVPVVGRARGRQLGNVTSPTTTGEAPVGTVATCSGPSSRPHSWLLAVGQ